MSEALHLRELLHMVSQGLFSPVMLILAIMIVYGLWCIGSLAFEAIVERRHFKVSMPLLIAAIDSSEYSNLSQVIEESGLLRFHKTLLQTLIAYGYLPEEARVALAKRLLSDAEQHYTLVVSRTDTIARIAPMFGLMATLIPLGPGVVALGQGDVTSLASSIEIAFDGTVAGLIVGAVCVIVSRYRKNWYEDYMVTMEAAASTVLEKAQGCAAQGIDIGDEAVAKEFLDKLKATHKPEKKVIRRRKGSSLEGFNPETLVSEQGGE